jgi:N-acetylglucosamine malate deacetylase 1
MPDSILIISPHTDDAELGCGGTISKFIEMEKDVTLLALSTAEKSIPSEFSSNSTKNEMIQACKTLGLDNDHIRILDFEVRVFPHQRQEILDSLIKIRNELNPQIVMVPSVKDTHQDHQVVTNEALRAFKKSSLSIYGYEQPWNCFTFDTNTFVELEEHHIKKKINALKQYKTQSIKEYFDEEFIRGLARTRGVTIGTKYAESFEVIKQIIR